jgi:hypothetical protein
VLTIEYSSSGAIWGFQPISTGDFTSRSIRDNLQVREKSVTNSYKDSKTFIQRKFPRIRRNSTTFTILPSVWHQWCSFHVRKHTILGGLGACSHRKFLHFRLFLVHSQALIWCHFWSTCACTYSITQQTLRMLLVSYYYYSRNGDFLALCMQYAPPHPKRSPKNYNYSVLTGFSVTASYH